MIRNDKMGQDEKLKYAVVFVVQNWLNFGNSYGLAK